MNVPEYMSQQILRMADSLAHFVAKTPEDKLTWHPALEGCAPTRSILEQISECVEVNRLIAAVLREGELPTPPADGKHEEYSSGPEAQEHLVSSARELASVVVGMTEADLQRPYNHPRGKFLGGNIIMMCLRNMAYHAGQVNLYQILYGDAEFHVPPTWR